MANYGTAVNRGDTKCGKTVVSLFRILIKIITRNIKFKVKSKCIRF